MNKKFLFSLAASAALSLPLAAEGVLPLEGKWVQGPSSSASGLQLDGNKVVGVVEIPRKNMKYARYSADQKIAAIKGDFVLSGRLVYECRDKAFLGYAYMQAVSTGNKPIATAGLYDAWEISPNRIYAGISGGKAALARKDLPFNGELGIKIERRGKEVSVFINGSLIMRSEGMTDDFGRIRLVFQTDARKGTKLHYGTFEFKDIKAEPLSADAPVTASVFDEVPAKSGFSAAWVAVRELNAKGLVYDNDTEAMTVIGFKDMSVKPGDKSAQYMLRRVFPAVTGDFTATLDMAWDLPGDRSFMGMADLQLVTSSGKVVANAGLTDGWIKGPARLSGGAGAAYTKEKLNCADQKSEVFRIERKNGVINVYAGAVLLASAEDNSAVSGVRVRFGQNMLFDANGNNLSKFGRFTVKRIAMDAPAK